eukprot:5763836-Ditylum_brightwellii.AAC.1
MDVYDVACTIDEAELKIWQWEKINVAKDKLQAISNDHGTINHGTYDYFDPNKPKRTTAEKIRYWWKDPVMEMVASVVGLINGYDLTPEEIDFIHSEYGGDHGKKKFRFAGKVVIRMKDSKCYDDIFGLADVACKKDNGIVLDNTVLPHLVVGINEMEASRFKFVLNDDANEDDSASFSINVVNQENVTAATPLEYYIKPT